MIFVITGSQKFQFNRLLKQIDDTIESGLYNEPVFAQTGYSDYVPKFYQYKNFLDQDVFNDMECRADIIITHGGTGAIVNSLKKGKKVIAVPRLEKYGEHVDNHQIQIINEFGKKNYVYYFKEGEVLGEVIKYVQRHEFKPYTSDNKRIIEDLDIYLASLQK